MRIIAGRFGKRQLHPLRGKQTRPTGDKVKGAIFNSLQRFDISGMCLDLYAGSGALGIEAVSRGAQGAVLCEWDRSALHTILQNIAVTREPERFTVMPGANQVALQRLASQGMRFSLVFLDPPYATQHLVADMQQLLALDLLEAEALVVCEADQQVTLPECVGPLTRWRHAQYGVAAIHFYQKKEGAGHDESIVCREL